MVRFVFIFGFIFFSVTSLCARSVFLGDKHGDLEAALSILFSLGIVDDEGHWNSNVTDRVYWAGDAVGKGPHSYALLLLAKRLQEEARIAGGEFEMVLGNHEVGLFEGRFDRLSLYDKRLLLTELNEPLDIMNLSEKEIDRLLPFVMAGDSDLIVWLRNRPAIVYDPESKSLVLHSGMSTKFSEMSPDELNALAHSLLDKLRMKEDPSKKERLLRGEFSPWNFWPMHRIRNRKDRKAEAGALSRKKFHQYLRQNTAVRMFAGHVRTVNFKFRIVPSQYYGEAFIRLDTSMTSATDEGQLSAFVVEKDQSMAIYFDRRFRALPGFMSLILRCNERLQTQALLKP